MSRLPAAERRKQLLDNAAELFAKHGYARATTAQLAKAAGVTEPIIYRHFASKRDLFVALIERTGRETLETWEQDLRDARDAGDRLHRLIGDNPMVSASGREAYRVFLQAITEVDDEGIREALNRHITMLHGFLTREIKAAQDENKVAARFGADLIAWVLIYSGLGYGVLSAMQIQGHGIDAEGHHVQEIFRRILTGRD